MLLYIRVRFVYIVFHFIFRLQFNLSFFNVRTVFKVQCHKQKAKFKNKAVTQWLIYSSFELTRHVFLLHLQNTFNCRFAWKWDKTILYLGDCVGYRIDYFKAKMTTCFSIFSSVINIHWNELYPCPKFLLPPVFFVISR